MLNILVVNQSAAIRKLLCRVVRNTDLPIEKIYEAAGGLEALETLKQNAIGLILSDVDMPCGNGLQLLAEIKQSQDLENIPVIMIASEASEDTVLEAAKLGAAGYICKPFTVEQLREKLINFF
jgi:two-component system chemotaxis response regulator CheY